MYFAVHNLSQHSLFHTALLISPGARVQNGFSIEKKKKLSFWAIYEILGFVLSFYIFFLKYHRSQN